jgi:serine/threonine protein kinase
MPSSVDLTGQRLGQYEIQEMIYSGTIVELYTAFQPGLDRQVGIQTLQKHLRHDRRNNQALAKAAKLIAGYEHPNIVPVFDFGVEKEITYVVMRQMQGGDLSHRLANGALPFQEIVSIVRQIASALEYVHSLGQIHGSPGTVNIVFDTWGSAYLSDFIVAGFLSEIQEGIIGIPAYLAPERWREEPPIPASDQYALSAITYEMLTGKLPFSQPGLVQKHLHDEPTAPHTLRPEIPLAVDEVILRGMAKAPEDRYSTVTNFARDFEKALNAQPQHLFISYSRRDKDFALALREHLGNNGFTLWIDDAIEHGDQWFNEIHDAIKNSAAFLVIMSPEAEKSEWVQKEILLAKRYKKAIFPLLLKGDEFAILIDIQYGDVRDGQMPGTDFHRRISRAVYGTGG